MCLLLLQWRLARCRDFLAGNLTPYFETGVDTVEDAAYRLTRVAISLARSIPLGAQAYVAIETVEVLRKHGLKGVYGLLLRKEFLAAADLLCRVLGINKQNWPLSVHELSAAIFYALAQHRALRGLRPDGEEQIHSLKQPDVGVVEKHAVDDESWLSSNSEDARTTSMLPVLQESNVEDDDAGDTIVWEGRQTIASEPILDDTDVYDPNSEEVIDLLAISASQKRGRSTVKQSKLGAINKTTSVADDNVNVNQPDGNDVDELPFEPVCEPVPDSVLASLLFYAPLALNFIYAECEVDMQLLAAQQGWRLVYASLDQSHHHSDDADVNDLESSENSSADKPASALFAHDEHKIACLSIRGTATIQDVVTDIRAMPVPFPQQEDDDDDYSTDTCAPDADEWTSVFRGRGLALCGMAGAALNLFRENADTLIYLAQQGYKIRIVGHSLGGGVAALLGILISRHMGKHNIIPKGFVTDGCDNRFLRVYGYGTPSLVDAKLADYTRAYVTNVVLHDDVVPRLTPTSIRGLLKHLLHIRETWVKAHLSNDLKCFHERAYHVWPTRLRGSFTLLKTKGIDSAKKLKKSYKKRIKEQKKSSAFTSFDDRQDHDYERDDNFSKTKLPSDDDDNEIGSANEDGLDVEGDLFFDPINDDPINESDDESSVGRTASHKITSSGVASEDDNDWAPFDEPPLETRPMQEREKLLGSDFAVNGEGCQEAIDATPQILDEFPLPRMFIPGKIVHMYTHRGGFKAAYVPRKFRQLRRISLAGNMLSDHMSKAYYEGLLEVKAIRAAKHDLPPWVGFDEDCTCACCASLFTWASTSNTEAQAARDKHNCRSCGGLVCDPCSKKRIPIPAIGLTCPVRVCDRCYNGWGTLFGGGASDDKVNKAGALSQSNEVVSKKNSSTQSRRSQVVDELASRIPSAVNL